MLFTLLFSTLLSFGQSPQQLHSTKKVKKILLVVTSNNQLNQGQPAGYYMPEVVDFVAEFPKNEYQFDVASPKGGEAPVFEKNNFLNDATVLKVLNDYNLNDKIKNTLRLTDAYSHINEYEAIHFVGGFGCLFDFPKDTTIKQMVKVLYEMNKPISAVCHGAAAFLNVKLSNGSTFLKNLTLTARTLLDDTGGNPDNADAMLELYFPIILELELRNEGAVFKSTQNIKSHVEKCNKIITGQTASSTSEVAREVKLLLSVNH
jgi:putative intracellular protease/amidase